MAWRCDECGLTLDTTMVLHSEEDCLRNRLAEHEAWKARMIELVNDASRHHNAEWCECPLCSVIRWANGGE